MHTGSYPLICIHTYYFTLLHNKIVIKTISICHLNQNYLGILVSFFPNCKIFPFKISSGHSFRHLIFKITSLLVYLRNYILQNFTKNVLYPKTFLSIFILNRDISVLLEFLCLLAPRTAMDRGTVHHWCRTIAICSTSSLTLSIRHRLYNWRSYAASTFHTLLLFPFLSSLSSGSVHVVSSH